MSARRNRGLYEIENFPNVENAGADARGDLERVTNTQREQ